jgi:Uncharacterized conserved protein
MQQRTTFALSALHWISLSVDVYIEQWYLVRCRKDITDAGGYYETWPSLVMKNVLGGEPRIDGTRIGVRHVATRVVDSGQSPAHVADQLDVSLAAVYEALSYYYEHLEEMRTLEADNEAAFRNVRESSLKPKETVQ